MAYVTVNALSQTEVDGTNRVTVLAQGGESIGSLMPCRGCFPFDAVEYLAGGGDISASSSLGSLRTSCVCFAFDDLESLKLDGISKPACS